MRLRNQNPVTAAVGFAFNRGELTETNGRILAVDQHAERMRRLPGKFLRGKIRDVIHLFRDCENPFPFLRRDPDVPFRPAAQNRRNSSLGTPRFLCYIRQPYHK